MKILYINNNGAGYANHIDISENTSVEQLFQKQIGGNPKDWLIRVNRQPVAADYMLQEGDRVSITPVRIEGAV